jgi:ferric-dicitrate binding protein FerR (iron transport regulator)
MAQRDIKITGDAINWCLEIEICKDLTRWEEFESWLRADARHREAYKKEHRDMPPFVRAVVNGTPLKKQH